MTKYRNIWKFTSFSKAEILTNFTFKKLIINKMLFAGILSKKKAKVRKYLAKQDKAKQMPRGSKTKQRKIV